MIFASIIDILDEKNYDELIIKYSRSNLVEAIFLTDTYEKFCNEIDLLEYQLVRFKYGKEISKNFLPQLVEKYPEHLI